MNKFTITFTGNKAAEAAERFFAYFWDGGLDQTIEQSFLEDFGLSLDDVDKSEDGAIIRT
jgi:hypothetical protein